MKDPVITQAFGDAPIGMAMISPRYDFRQVNREYRKLVGYARRDLLGMTLRDVTHPPDWAMTVAALRAAREGRAIVRRFENRFVRKNGDVRWGSVHMRKIRATSSNPAGLLLQVVDITAQREMETALRLSEARFRVALSDTDITIHAHDRDLRYIWAYNLSPEFTFEDLIGKRPSDVLDPRTAKASEAIKRRVIKNGVHRRDEVTCYLPGKAIIYDVYTHPWRDEHGKIAGVICASFNITERKRLEHELTKIQGHLIERIRTSTGRLRILADALFRAEDRERERIASLLHDDLQQLFVGAQYHLKVLASGLTDSARHGSLDQVRRALTEAMSLSRSLCLDLRPPVLDMEEWEPMLHWIANDAKAKFGLSVRIRITQVPPLASRELRAFAFDAIRELVLNVAKHAGVKTAEVRVSQDGRGQVAVEVSDRGRWTDPDSDSTNTLGLVRIHTRAEAVGGRFCVGSDSGRTRAILTLPLR